MEVEIPKWFNKEFLSDCLQNGSNDRSVRVESFHAESAVPPGNNYGSIVVRVHLTYNSQSSTLPSSKSLIVKLPLTSGFVNEMFDDTENREYTFYHDYLPKAYEKLKRTFTPKSYPSSTQAVVILEDLKVAGFVMEDKQAMLGFENCKKYAESAAVFHAGSVSVFKQYPELCTRLCEEFMFSNEAKGARTQKNIIRYGMEELAERTFKLTGDKRMSSVFQKCSTLLWDMLVECMKPTGALNTINQGDPWTTNMMFKYDNNGSCVDIRILDFQRVQYSSPASDLTFFIWCSAKHYVREERFDDILHTYTNVFNDCLKESGCQERISKELMKNEMLRMSPLAFWTGGICNVILLYDSVPDFEGLFKVGDLEYSSELNPLKKMFTEDFCKTQLPRLLNQFNDLGVFDYMEKLIEAFDRH